MRQKLVSLNYLKRNLETWLIAINKRANLSLGRDANTKELASGIIEILENDGCLDRVSTQELFSRAIN